MGKNLLKKYLRIFIYWRPIREFLHLTRKVTLPGFQKVPIFDVARFFITGLINGTAITQRAAAMSFSFFLALFPSVLFLFTLLPYLPIKHLQNLVYENLAFIVPDAIYPTVRETIDGILIQKHGSLLSFGFLGTLFFASNGVDAIMKAFNQTTHDIETRKFMTRRLVGILLVLCIVVLVVVTFGFMVGYNYMMRYFVEIGLLNSQFVYYLLIIGKWLILLALAYLTVSFVYFLAPARKQGFSFFSAGSILATSLFVLLSVGFNIYIENFSRYNALYGSIGTLIILLLWIYFNAIVLLLGFELNASIAESKNKGNHIKSYKKEDTGI